MVSVFMQQKKEAVKLVVNSVEKKQQQKKGRSRTFFKNFAACSFEN